MESSAKIIKVTGIFYIIHGLVMTVIAVFLALTTMFNGSILWGLLVLMLIGGMSFLYIYVGYGIFSFCESGKMKDFLIAAMGLACIEIVAAVLKGEMTVIIFVIELVLSIVAICNIGSYKEYKNKIDSKNDDVKIKKKKTVTKS